jgi:hypothetical protein
VFVLVMLLRIVCFVCKEMSLILIGESSDSSIANMIGTNGATRDSDVGVQLLFAVVTSQYLRQATCSGGSSYVTIMYSDSAGMPICWIAQLIFVSVCVGFVHCICSLTFATP